jgi:hypothetical protein
MEGIIAVSFTISSKQWRCNSVPEVLKLYLGTTHCLRRLLRIYSSWEQKYDSRIIIFSIVIAKWRVLLDIINHPCFTEAGLHLGVPTFQTAIHIPFESIEYWPSDYKVGHFSDLDMSCVSSQNSKRKKIYTYKYFVIFLYIVMYGNSSGCETVNTFSDLLLVYIWKASCESWLYELAVACV